MGFQMPYTQHRCTAHTEGRQPERKSGGLWGSCSDFEGPADEPHLLLALIFHQKQCKQMCFQKCFQSKLSSVDYTLYKTLLIFLAWVSTGELAPLGYEYVSVWR